MVLGLSDVDRFGWRSIWPNNFSGFHPELSVNSFEPVLAAAMVFGLLNAVFGANFILTHISASRLYCWHRCVINKQAGDLVD